MKKIVLAVSSVLVAGAMLFAFVGCDSKSKDVNNNEPQSEGASVVEEMT